MADFTIQGVNYRSSKMPVMLQIKVMKRLTGIMTSLQEASKVAREYEETLRLKMVAWQEANPDKAPDEMPEPDDAESAIFTMAAPIALAIKDMSDEDFDFIAHSCLSHVQIQIGESSWGPIWSISGKRPMNEDMSPIVIISICIHTMKSAFSGFFPALPSILSASGRG